jgi:hypothetical protein
VWKIFREEEGLPRHLGTPGIHEDRELERKKLGASTQTRKYSFDLAFRRKVLEGERERSVVVEKQFEELRTMTLGKSQQ